jgi:TolB-like protein
LSADYIVIGQVQLLDGGVIVRAHLIRAADQAHVWVNMMRRTAAGEAAFQSDVAGQIHAALAARALPTPTSSR